MGPPAMKTPRKLSEEESSVQRHARKPSSVLGPDTLFDFGLFRLDLRAWSLLSAAG